MDLKYLRDWPPDAKHGLHFRTCINKPIGEQGSKIISNFFVLIKSCLLA